MSMQPVSVAERVAYGRVEDPDRDPMQVHLAPRPFTALAGRWLMAAIFLVSGIAKVNDPAGTVEHMVKAGIPAADVLVWIAAIAELAGAAALITGFLTRIGAIGLILFLIPATLFFHDFWDYSGADAVPQMANFMKNVAIGGGLAYVIAFGPGRYSLDHKLRWPIQA
jgi:putative oxidoreductase